MKTSHYIALIALTISNITAAQQEPKVIKQEVDRLKDAIRAQQVYISALEKEIERLKAENAKLQTEILSHKKGSAKQDDNNSKKEG